MPDLMIMSLPCDHTEGTNPKYPTPRAMMADNDLALGRVVEAVSKSPQWKETCIFVVEDDAQSGPDHVDGHRTVFMAISPYNRRKTVDSTFYTQTNMIRSIEMMLGLDPMNKFDSVADPMVACFSDQLDLTPYRPVAEQRAARRTKPLGRGHDRRRSLLAGEDPVARLEPPRRARPLLDEPDHLVQPLQGNARIPRAAGRGARDALMTTMTTMTSPDIEDCPRRSRRPPSRAPGTVSQIE